MTTEILKNCFDRNKCDKASKHHYHNIYYPILDDLINQSKQTNKRLEILEIGIFKGASIAALIEYFKSVNFNNYFIYGIDTFQRIKPEDIDILNHNKVDWLDVDSTNINDINDININQYFDLIIDDGNHSPVSQYLTFLNFIPLLEETGYYLIEDVWPFHKMTNEEKKHKWILEHKDYYNEIHFNKLKFSIGCDLYKLKEYDNRKLSGEPDSFIFEVRHKI